MINNAKNEKDNIINNIIMENFDNDLNDLLVYGKWELSLISSLKYDKNYKQNLILIDKEWLFQWKKLSGYNYIKNQIFKYLTVVQKKNNINIEEDNKMLNNAWVDMKQKYKINSNNLQKLKPMNNKQILVNYNNRKIINGKGQFDVISNDIYDIFKKYLDKNVIIRVGGLFIKKKLLLPFNYNDKNIDYIYIDMLFINNNKNDIEEILFSFPKLNISIIEKIRKEITNKEINEFTDSFNKENEKELFFIDNGNKHIYKALKKNTFLPNLNINTHTNDLKSNELKENINNIHDNKTKEETINNNIIDNNKKEENNDILNINNIKDIMDINNIDINNLTYEQLEAKIKEIDLKVNEMMEIENNINKYENLYLNEQKYLEEEKIKFNNEKINYNNNKLQKNSSKKLDNINNDNNLNNEYNKYIEHLKEIEFKNQYLFDEIEKYKEKEIKLNNEYKKIKNEYQQKENELNIKINQLNNKEKIIKSKDDKLFYNLHKKEGEIRNKEEILKKKEEELNIRKIKLEEKEKEINEKEKKNIEKQNMIENKNEELLQKLKIFKDIEQKNNEKINDELEEEIKNLEKNINQKEDKGRVPLDNMDEEEANEEKDDMQSEHSENSENRENTENVENDQNGRISVKGSNNNKFRRINSLQEDNDNKVSKIKSDKNVINFNLNKDKDKDKENKNKNKFIRERISQPTFISSKTLTSPNINDFLSDKKIPLIIDKNKPSLGLIKQKKIVNLNSIIQCFAHLKEITDGILNLESLNNSKEDEKNKLSKAYSNLLKNLFFPENNKNMNVCSALDIYDILIKEKPEFKSSNNYWNTRDLLDIIINGLHTELNTKTKINKPITNNNNKFEELNEKDALFKYLEEFTKSNNSIISKNLYGLLKKKIICQGCKKEKYNFMCYSFLYFNVSEIKQFINQENKNKKLKLKDFFDYYNKPEYLIEENGLYCNHCKSKNTTTILKSIYSTHPILPIIIDRGDDSNLNKDKIDFPDELDISKYIEYKNSSKKFYLCGVVSNFGFSNNFGKFEAFCKMEQNGQWYNYNDEKVSSSTIEDVHNKGIHYILFYHKI